MPVPEAVARTSCASSAAPCGMSGPEPLTYADAGVSLRRPTRSSTGCARRSPPRARRGVLGDLGGFAGLLSAGGYRDPVLVAGTDGVGTKLLLQRDAGRLRDAGIDLVGMCVNDVLTHRRDAGAVPRLRRRSAGSIPSASRRSSRASPTAAGRPAARCSAARRRSCPTCTREADFDLAGFALGIAERDGARRRRRASPRATSLIGLAVGRRPLQRLLARAPPARARRSRPRTTRRTGCSRRRASTRPRCARCSRPCDVRAMAHVTGGGIPGNLPRVLPEGLGARLDAGAWERPAVFDWLAGLGVERGRDAPRLQPAASAISRSCPAERRRAPRPRRPSARRRGRSAPSSPARASRSSECYAVGVLVSGSGSNLQALIDRSHGREIDDRRRRLQPGRCVRARTRAGAAGIATAVFPLADTPTARRATARWRRGWRRAASSSSSARASWSCSTPASSARFPGAYQRASVAAARVPRLDTRSRTPCEAGVRETGVTVISSTRASTPGRVLAQAACPCTTMTRRRPCARRIHAVEHRLLPATVKALARRTGRRRRGKGTTVRIKRALISVSDKTGLDVFATGSRSCGVELIVDLRHRCAPRRSWGSR